MKGLESAAMRTATILVDGTTDGALVVDRLLQVVHFNRNFVEFTAERPSRLKRMSAGGEVFQLPVFRPQDRESCEQCLKTGRSYSFTEVKGSNAAGHEFVVLLAFNPIFGDEGQVEGVIISFRDLTPEARLQTRYKEMLAREKARAEELERKVEERTQQLAAALEKVTQLSRIDPLTGLANRRAFSEYAEQALKIAFRHQRSVAFLMLDLDHFKKVNDDFGHQAGDAVLKAVSGVLQKNFRESDKVARLGGEEFAVLLTETVPQAVRLVAERCRQSVFGIQMKDVVPQKSTPQSVSIGMAIFPDHGTNVDQLLSAADKALYEAKDGGRNRVVLFSGKGRAEDASPAKIARILVVDANRDRLSFMRRVLENRFEVVLSSSAEDAIGCCSSQAFDVLLVDERVGHVLGVEILQNTLGPLPNAVRLLVIESQDMYLAMRGSNSARVDRFLLRDDSVAYLESAIEDSLLRANLRRTKSLTPPDLMPAVGEQAMEAFEEIVGRDRLHFAYQPIVKIGSDEVLGHEAFCRPDHERFENPAVFFETALRFGSLWEVGRQVRRSISADIPAFPGESKIFINLHPMEIGDNDLLDGEAFLLPWAERVVFEITERAAVPDTYRFQERIETLRGHGFKVAVDDLGAGYASLNSVAMLRPNFIKLGRALIGQIHESDIQQRLAQSVVYFAAQEGIQVVAEGVELPEEARVVEEIGCNYMQGNLVLPPTRLPELKKRFSK